MDRNDSRPVNGPMDEPADDPARQFLDQTVPREDYWEGREPEEGPARPRHVQHPVEHAPPPDPKVQRKQAIRNAAWTFGPTAGLLGASALLNSGSAQADPLPEPPPDRAPEPPPDPDPMSHDPSGGYGGEIGSGL
jgi:hypothetical protein